MFFGNDASASSNFLAPVAKISNQADSTKTAGCGLLGKHLGLSKRASLAVFR